MSRKKKKRLSPAKRRLTKRSTASKSSSPVDIQLNQAVEYHRGGHLRKAAKIYKRILRSDPDYPAALHLLGFIAFQRGKIDSATSLMGHAVRSDPTNAVYHSDLGNMYQNQKRWKDAVPCYEKAIQLNPDYAEAYNNLGLALQSLGESERALTFYEKALQLRPDLVAVYNHMGSTLQDLARYEEAISFYQKALQKNPNYEKAYYNLGSAFEAQGKFEEAISYYEKAIRLNPNLPQAHFNIGNAYSNLRKPDEAIDFFKKALQLNPVYAEALSSLFHETQKCCSWQELSELNSKLDDFVKRALELKKESPERPFINISRCADLSRNFAVAKSVSTEIARRIEGAKIKFSFDDRKTHERRIIIGYVSNDFYNHPTAHLMLSLFGLHNRDEFEIFCYSYGIDDGTYFRKQIQRDCDKFIDISQKSHVEAAQCIYEDHVDILVDLKGYTTGSRLDIFAFRPAPVQVGYLGFPGTTGADFLDYIITDKIVTPEEHAIYYSENFAYLPHCYQVNDHTQAIANNDWKRTDFGLPESGLVFCSFNQSYKIEPAMFHIWMRILQQVPDSVLWLQGGGETAIKNLMREAELKGVKAERLVFGEKLPKSEHLRRLQLADLGLDTHIVNGHTTTSDALWAGVPVIAVQGNHFASRVSASLLTAIGLPELITETLEEYEALAVKLGSNPNDLKAIRKKLSKHRQTKPLFDTPRFTRDLESVYKQFWKIFILGEKPRQIAVEELRADR
jgi:protein O-GlcNAc transferase